MSYRESALQLAVVAQHNCYSFDFDVLQVVLMGRSPHKKILDRDNAEDYAIARHALETVGLAGLENAVSVRCQAVSSNVLFWRVR